MDKTKDTEREQQEAHVTKLASMISHAQTTDKEFLQGVLRNRRYMAGDFQKPKVKEDSNVVETPQTVNIIYPIYKVLLPSLYHKNPVINITPRKQVEPDEQIIESQRKLAETLKIVLQKQISDGDLKSNAKACTNSAYTTAVGWMKVIYQENWQDDPTILNRVQDSQKELARLQALSKEDEKTHMEMSEDNRKARMQELEQMIVVLQQSPEVMISQGLIYDKINTEDIVVDEAVNYQNYEMADWIAHGVWLKKEVAREKYTDITHKDWEECKTYSENRGLSFIDDNNQTGETLQKDKETDYKPEYFRVYEVWSKPDRTVYTIIDGMKIYARVPFQMPSIDGCWFPFYPLIYNPLDGKRHPISDVEAIISAQDEYNSIRTKQQLHRQAVKPTLLVDAGAMKDKDTLFQIAAHDVMEVLALRIDDGRNIQDTITPLIYPQIDPALYDVSKTLEEIDYVTGVGDANRAQVTRQKTLGEAEIINAGFQGRTGERRDITEDWLKKICMYSVQMMIEKMTPDQVVAIAGKSAIWPHADKTQLRLLNLRIQTGSTAETGEARRREQWLQLLPFLRDLVDRVAASRAQGIEPTGMINIAQETIRRFDENLDIEEFLPFSPNDPMEQQLLQAMTHSNSAEGAHKKASTEPNQAEAGKKKMQETAG